MYHPHDIDVPSRVKRVPSPCLKLRSKGFYQGLGSTPVFEVVFSRVPRWSLPCSEMFSPVSLSVLCLVLFQDVLCPCSKVFSCPLWLGGDQNSANVWALGCAGSGNILFQRRMSSFLREPTASLRGDHELQPQSLARFTLTHSSLLSCGLAYSSFFSSPAKTTLSGQGYWCCWWRR